MYIQVTVELNNYKRPPIELRLSNQHPIKKLIDITWRTVKMNENPKEGYWIRVKNKDAVFTGTKTLEECGITTGDCVEIL
ncbi:EsaB/YukD family protein [Oceanobacillus senegalensis]|uniref:EsaB/YukD family protein n=1 Tax=Oceanobacillus senegalensis TaxID=1936063 RepID=UPI000A312B02|nr:EsaB/YukD family protein [Oceanobacillus senegalensis]